MKRATVLTLLLALAPLTWAEEASPEAGVESPTEPAETPSADAAVSAASEAAAPPESSVVTPVDSGPAEPSTVTPVATTEAAPARAEETPEASHRVVRGDTLWDLAGTYLKNPFLWPKIFEANRDKIHVPQLIYPDQEFVIPTVEAAQAQSASAPSSVPESVEEPAVEAPAAEAPSKKEEAPAASEAVAEKPAPEAAPAEAVAPEIPEDDRTVDEREAKKKKSQAVPGAGFMGGMADSFLADENWEYDGYVLRDRDQRMMISQGDVVFLNIGAASGVKPKMVANVYRVGKKVKDPYLKKKTGRMVKRVGAVIVTGQITDEGCTAVVTNSLEPIRIGDIVKFVPH